MGQFYFVKLIESKVEKIDVEKVRKALKIRCGTTNIKVNPRANYPRR